MQTKTIFHPALALLLCGAAMLGLGPWENAAGQGQTPILFSENPQGFNECIANYGEFAIVGTDGDAQCTPRPPGWTPPAPVVVPPPGGVEVDEPAAPSPPEPARIAVSIFNPPGTPPDYSRPSACLKFGGVAEEIANAKEYVCSEIDINDTFCFGGSKEALPCKGLYDHVRRCNYYNRRTLDPFYCAQVCATGFACGDECESATIGDPTNTREWTRSNRPFPEGTNESFLFLGTATAGTPGEARYELLQEGTALSLIIPNSAFVANNWAPVFLVDPTQLAEDGQRYAATLRASFSCGGLEKKYGGDLFSFEIITDSNAPHNSYAGRLADLLESLQ